MEKIGSTKNFRAAFDGPPAPYDIDVVEAHVAQLVEQGWSPRLGSYAVALAMGFNELADPGGAQCESVTMEAFEQRAESYELEFEDLVSRVGQEFAALAKIPPANRDDFSLNVAQVVTDWVWRVNPDNNYGREFLDCLRDTERSAATMHRNLERLHRHLNELEHTAASQHLMPSVISRMLRYLPVFISGIRLTMGLTVISVDGSPVSMPRDERQGRPRGRRRGGLKQYAGLAELVSELEFTAQECGGGFGIPNKKLKKGRLIQALDLLRALLTGSNHWRWLPEFLPAPGQHPLSVYEGGLMKVYNLNITRNEAVAENNTETESGPAQARIDLAEARRMRAMMQTMRYIVDA